MCSSVAPRLWFLTDRRIREDYPQQEILRALKAKCCEEELDFRALVMDEVVLTIEHGNLGLRVNGELITAYPQVVVVRVPTPWVQSDSDITVLRHLEKMGCRLMNRPQAILNCVNKFWTFQELAGHGVPLPDTFSYGGHENFAKMIDEAEVLEFPMVVKNTRGHRGKAVFLARDKHHLADLSHLIRHEAPYLFQKYVKESHGKDVRVIVVGGRVVGTMLRCSTDGRMQSNCSLGGVGMMCSLSEQGKQLAVQVSNILGMDVCGIDLLMKDDGSFYVCEANANVYGLYGWCETHDPLLFSLWNCRCSDRSQKSQTIQRKTSLLPFLMARVRAYEKSLRMFLPKLFSPVMQAGKTVNAAVWWHPKPTCWQAL
ncbi:beta-citrylglutamate synthase B isoform X3 [Natator depressus]|uniref:beta-citrylglutamate synthase B isoform X3 n=1 Tax=Natator depressus TaxID=27790 RepID=UPI003EB76D79